MDILKAKMAITGIRSSDWTPDFGFRITVSESELRISDSIFQFRNPKSRLRFPGCRVGAQFYLTRQKARALSLSLTRLDKQETYNLHAFSHYGHWPSLYSRFSFLAVISPLLLLHVVYKLMCFADFQVSMIMLPRLRRQEIIHEFLRQKFDFLGQCCVSLVSIWVTVLNYNFKIKDWVL